MRQILQLLAVNYIDRWLLGVACDFAYKNIERTKYRACYFHIDQNEYAGRFYGSRFGLEEQFHKDIISSCSRAYISTEGRRDQLVIFHGFDKIDEIKFAVLEYTEDLNSIVTHANLLGRAICDYQSLKEEVDRMKVEYFPFEAPNIELEEDPHPTPPHTLKTKSVVVF